ncbi:MAG TPA: OsmC family protein [Polyangiaceae bacterium]|jgi:putative redox protein|nr:OsmC family protein [Polyangiaceae bacterium]
MSTNEQSIVIVQGRADSLTQTVEVGPHRLLSDEPVALGGGDQGPDPYELLLASLGSCTSMTLALYARRKQWPLEAVTVRLRHAKIHASDCMDCETKQGKIDLIEREIELSGPLTAEQRTALLAIADRCPVHRSLTSSEISIKTQLVEKDGP